MRRLESSKKSRVNSINTSPNSPRLTFNIKVRTADEYNSHRPTTCVKQLAQKRVLLLEHSVLALDNKKLHGYS
ncbi:hypothetical protein M514_05644 [Trichuris suis]|uniref:Uncharacterized protein n=1 Tax=Trichuris suis TaxID=68888 RepID=A0A085NQP3_9BILA|nr:hypothetical protein M514_05644 [Trichuris suis]